jgi:hypothetical protein
VFRLEVKITLSPKSQSRGGPRSRLALAGFSRRDLDQPPMANVYSDDGEKLPPIPKPLAPQLGKRRRDRA